MMSDEPILLTNLKVKEEKQASNRQHSEFIQRRKVLETDTTLASSSMVEMLSPFNHLDFINTYIWEWKCLHSRYLHH